MQFCSEVGCGVLVPHGRCAAHAGLYDQARGNRHARGYTNNWARRAARFRARYPLCGQRPGGLPPVMSQCYDEGRVTLATQVDHVIPHKQNHQLFWDEENWQSLCDACHTRKTTAGQ